MRRFRRLRANEAIRSAFRENHLSVSDFMYPMFVVEGTGVKVEIPSMPDIYRFSIDELEKEIKIIYDLGIDKIMLFGIPNHKDPEGTQAYAEDGITQRAIAAVKRVCPEMYVAADVCLCEYTSHGHCGLIDGHGCIQNDDTLELLAKTAVSQAKAGADMVAPSDMMDGRIGALRKALDDAGFTYVALMAYSAKYASSYYGPFREAAGSAPQFGNRKTYQMDHHNGNEALRVMAYDWETGADIIMVKPALAYLDVLSRAKDSMNVPLAVYNVSGEYTMLKNAVMQGVMDQSVIYESLISMKRAGADLIITYFAKEMAEKGLCYGKK